METYIGSICAFGFNFQATDWLYCWGQTVQTSQYQALFALIAGVYGPVGNGSSTFVIPDLRGRTMVGQGVSPFDGIEYELGSNGGSESVALDSTTYPAHNHNMSLSLAENNTANGVASPVGAFPGIGPGSGRALTSLYAPTPSSSVRMAALAPVTFDTTGTGVNYPTLDIRRPFLAVNYMIAAYGTFPPRS